MADKMTGEEAGKMTGIKAPALNRRAFLAGATALTFSVGASGLLAAHDAESAAKNAINAWIRISPDDAVTLIFPITEMGQGSSTALPVILAEELDADWDRVEVDQLSRDDRTYGNPIFGNVLYTAGSTGVYGYFDALRKAGAQARAFLISIAARHWGVGPETLITEPSVVVHPASGRRLSYGAITGLPRDGIALPDPEAVRLKDTRDHRLIGQHIDRLDIPAKSTGRETYAYDVQVDGMLYAEVLRSPVEGERPAALDDAAARAVPGVHAVVPLPDGAAVVAGTQYAARAGKAALSVTWTTTSAARTFDSDQALEAYRRTAEDLSQTGVPWHRTGDAGARITAAAKTLSATYLCDHAYHAQIEPMAVTAHVDADGTGAEVWAGTQSQSWTMRTITETLGTTQDRVRLHMMTMGGSFGRRTELSQDYVRDALLASKAVGRPVKVLWTREDDLKFGRFRPAAAQHLRAGLKAHGSLSGWHHRVAAPSVIADFNPLRWQQVAPKDIISMRGSESRFYALPDMLAEYLVTARAARLAPWRGIGASYTSFAAEAFMDEVAEAAGLDPLAFRRQLLKENPRGHALLTSVAEMAGWGRPRTKTAPRETAPWETTHGETGLGVAFAGYGDSMAAGIAEIALDRETGEIRVTRFWAAVDAGLVVSPDNARSQIEGGIVFGMGNALKERVTIKAGHVEQENFYDYPVMRNDEVPEIEIDLKTVDAPPTGIGEVGTPMVAPAIANAFYALTGKRLRHMPFTPERVLQALKG